MLVLLFFHLIIYVLGQNCLIPNKQDDTKCKQCKHLYYYPNHQAFDQEFQSDQCQAASEEISDKEYYVSSTCTSSCDGSSDNPFPTLLDAIDAIPYGINDMAPIIQILIKDQDTYILPQNQQKYYNRRKFVYIIIKPDPNSVFQGSPRIILKTQKVAIFVSVGLVIQDFIIEGIGMNEWPVSFSNKKEIHCTLEKQQLNHESAEGISNEDNQNIVHCGIQNYQQVQSDQSEMYGLLNSEAIFEIQDAVRPLILIQNCVIQNIYSIAVQPRFDSFIKLQMLLPARINFINVELRNCYFENGIITSKQFINWFYIGMNDELIQKYQIFKQNNAFEVEFSDAKFSQYNDRQITSYDDNTGALLTMENHPLQLTFKDTQIFNLNISIPQMFYFEQDDQYGIMSDGFVKGHYSLVHYQSKYIQRDANNIPQLSFLKIDNLEYFDISPASPFDYFQQKLDHNQIEINALNAISGVHRYGVIFSNCNFQITESIFKKIQFNFYFFSEKYHSENALFKIEMTFCDFIECIPFYVDDRINEFNSIFLYDNRTNPSLPIESIIIYDHIRFINLTDMVLFEGNDMQPKEGHFKNIDLLNYRRIKLIWSSFSSWFQQYLYIYNFNIIEGILWEAFNLKFTPDITLIENLYYSKAELTRIIIFIGNRRRGDNYQMIFNNLTLFSTLEDFQNIQAYLRILIFDDSSRSTLEPKELSRIVINNSNLTFPFKKFDEGAIFFAQSPFHKVLQNTYIYVYGTNRMLYVNQEYLTSLIQTFVISNCTFVRYKFANQISEDFQDQQARLDDLDYYLILENHQLNITNTVFYDEGLGFSKILLKAPYQCNLTNITFHNYGIQIVSARQKVYLTNLKMTYTNTNSTSFYVFVEGSKNDQQNQNVVYSQNSQDSSVILVNSKLYGNLTQGMIQIANSKIKILNTLLQTTGSNEKKKNQVKSQIVLKQNSWVLIDNSILLDCNDDLNVKKSCVEAYENTILESYNSKFENSIGTFGGFIYTYKSQIFLKGNQFYNGEANKGGSIFLLESKLEVQNSLFNKSKAIYQGGHIYGDKCQLILTEVDLLNGYSEDTGSSIYLIDSISVNLNQLSFKNLYSKEKIGLKFQNSVSKGTFNLENIKFYNVTANSKIIGMEIINFEGSIKNVLFDRTILINLESQYSLIFIDKSELDINNLTIQDSQSSDFLYLKESVVKIQNLIIINSYFIDSILNIQNSELNLRIIKIEYENPINIIENIKRFSENFNFKFLKYIIIASKSELAITNSTIDLLEIFNQQQEDDLFIFQYANGIQSKDCFLQMENCLFTKKQVEATIDLKIEPFNQLLQDDITNQNVKASILAIENGQIKLQNLSLPNYAIKYSLISLVNCQYNLINIRKNDLDLISQSVIQNLCKGLYSELLCIFIDFTIQINKVLEDELQFLFINSTIFSYGTVFYINQTTLRKLIFKNMRLQQRESISNSQLALINKANLEFSNVSFIKFQDSFLIQNNSRIEFFGCLFQQIQNSATKIEDSNVTFYQTQFIQNQGNEGGAIYASCLEQINIITIQNCFFYQNQAIRSGGAIRNIQCDTQINNTLFKQNTADYGDDFLGYPNSIILNQIIQFTTQSLSSIASLSFEQSQSQLQLNQIQNNELYVIAGQKSAMMINLVDNFQQIYPLRYLLSDDLIQQIISKEDTNNTINFVADNINFNLVQYHFELLQNTIIIEEIYIYGSSNTQAKFYINDINLGIFDIKFLQCPQGSILSSDRCFFCPDQTYSLNPLSDKCENCGKFQICNGKNYLYAELGYFIIPNTSHPEPCPVMEACSAEVISTEMNDQIFLLRFYKSQLPEEKYNQLTLFIADKDLELERTSIDQKCLEGYQGIYCVICSPGYGQTSDGFCYKCDSDSTLYIRFAISTIVILGLNYVDSIEPLEEEDDDEPVLSGVLLKQLTDFTQFVNIIVGMAANISIDILPALAILTDQISLFPSDFDSALGCFFLQEVKDPILLFRYKLLISVIIPWFYLILMIILIILIDKIKKWKKMDSIPKYVSIFDIFTVTFVATFYNFYFYLAQTGLTLFSCVNVDDPVKGSKSILVSMSDIECWQKDHLFLIFAFAFPICFIYILGIPLIFIFFISKYYKNPEETPQEFDKVINFNPDNESFLVGKLDEENKNQEQGSIQKQNKAEVSERKSEFENKQEEKSEKEVQINYSVFLTENLLPPYKYWDIYIHFKKIIIIILMILSQSIGVKITSIFVLIFFVAFTMISHKQDIKFNSYEQEELNNFQRNIDFVLTIIIHLVLLMIQSGSVLIQIFAVIFLLILKFGVNIYGLKIIVLEYLAYFKKLAQKKIKNQKNHEQQ